MTQALFFKASYERLQERITHVAPELEVALYDEGVCYLNGEQVELEHLSPEYFWIHPDLLKSGQLKDYFNLVINSSSAKWLHTVHTGLDILPYINLLEKGISISNNHSQAIAIAEYVMGQILSYYQNIASFQHNQREKKWQYRRFKEIQGEHWLFVGFGQIAQEIAIRAKAFGVTVSTARRSQQAHSLADKTFSLDDIDQHLPDADVVILACTSNEKTRGLVDARFLSKMKDTATLINVARGDLVKEDDLKIALDLNQPAYAILDVFQEEPVAQDSWIWSQDNLALTPHCSNAGSGMLQRSDDLFIENLSRKMKGKALRNVVASSDIL